MKFKIYWMQNLLSFFFLVWAYSWGINPHYAGQVSGTPKTYTFWRVPMEML